MSVAPGNRLGPYDIVAELGHGGRGVVYTAQDPRLKRQVAIKLLPARADPRRHGQAAIPVGGPGGVGPGPPEHLHHS